MMASPETNPMEPSSIDALTKAQTTKLVPKNGKNSSTGLPKINPNTNPIATI
jgi:hypothetical protein